MAHIRVPKRKDFTVMANYHFRDKNLSLKTIGLLSLMLSLPDTWDYTTRGLVSICKDGESAITAALKEMEKEGYLTRKRIRDKSGKLGETEYTIHEMPLKLKGKAHDGEENIQEKASEPNRENPDMDNHPMAEKEQESRTSGAKVPDEPDRDYPDMENRLVVENAQNTGDSESFTTLLPDLDLPDLENPDLDNPDVDNPVLEKPDLGFPRLDYPNQENRGQLSTNKKNTHSAKTNPSNIHPSNQSMGMDMSEIDALRQRIQGNIEYNTLVLEYGKERLDEVVEIILETVCGCQKDIFIGGTLYHPDFVCSRLWSLTSCHIQYVFLCLDSNSTKIHNIKKYLLATLFNAPTTMDSYYTAEVNHDMGTMQY